MTTNTEVQDSRVETKPAPHQAPPADTKPTSRGKMRLFIVLLVLAGAGYAAWRFIPFGHAVPPGIIQVSGRIESDDSAVAAKTAGRVREVRVREGDRVKTGDIIAVLDDPQTLARKEQAERAAEQSQARLDRARQQIAVWQEQINQSEMGVAQSRVDAQGRVTQAESQLAAAEFNLAQTKASYEQAKYDAEKFGKLASEGAESERTATQARNTAEAQAAAVQAARKQVDAARGAVEMANANLANPAIRSSQTVELHKQRLQVQADIEGAQADLEHARAQIREAEANLNDLKILAPFDATVATRSAEPGEVIAAGTPIVTLVNYDLVYLRGFVPEGEIGRVRVGQAARVYLDSDQKRPLEAVVIRVDPEASFTPENTYFRNDRVKQVVGLKLGLKHAEGFAKPGMPADGEILVDGDTWPANTGR
jgi:HlyD family secretion protein